MTFNPGQEGCALLFDILAVVATAFAAFARAEILEVPNAARSSSAPRSQEAAFVVQPSPKEIQSERQSILVQERESQAAPLGN